MIIVVKKCDSCPLCHAPDPNSGESEETLANVLGSCAVSTPAHRPIFKDGDIPPSFCPFRREQIIFRQFD